MKLFMLLLGALPPGRTTEQHDVFFGIARDLKALKKDIMDFWPEAGTSLHIDVSREVTTVDGYAVSVVSAGTEVAPHAIKLFFLNLGGYKPNEFEEYHYKMLVAAPDKGTAVSRAKNTAFYKHYNLKGAASHIDEKYGIDVDDFYLIEDILADKYRSEYKIVLAPSNDAKADNIHPGYLRISKL